MQTVMQTMHRDMKRTVPETEFAFCLWKAEPIVRVDVFIRTRRLDYYEI